MSKTDKKLVLTKETLQPLTPKAEAPAPVVQISCSAYSCEPRCTTSL